MAIKKTELYSSLWASCDELRGGMDASQYKDYVLTFLFLKYVSDKSINDPKAMIMVPEGCTFPDIVNLKGNKEIGEKLNIVLDEIATKNDMSWLSNKANDFNDEERLGKDKTMVDTLSKLVGIFEGLDFASNSAQGDDLLGDAYEYLMRNFATESGKSKGQFYTPAEVSRILAKVVGITKDTIPSSTVYDPTCGSGSLLLKVADEAPNGISIYGQEKDSPTTALCRMNMILHNNADAEIAPGGYNTLANPEFKADNTELKTFDFAVANPPFSSKNWVNGFKPEEDVYTRFEYGIPPEKNGDYAFLLHILKSLKSTGKAAVILPHGVLFRGNAESDIRRNLIKQGYIKGIIGLPANLFYGTGIPACIIVIDKAGAKARLEDDDSGIFMIDASKGFAKDGPKNRLREQDLHKIVDVFNTQITQAGFSRMVGFDEIEGHDYNLNIPRYIDSSEAEDLHDLSAHLSGGIPNADIEALDGYWQVFPTLRKTLFKDEREGYSQALVKAAKVKTTILDHAEFKQFAEKALSLYEQWKAGATLTDITIDTGSETESPKDIIHRVSGSLLHAYTDAPLLNRYDMYQIIMDYWADVMQDDVYFITQDGWLSGNSIRELVVKKGVKLKETPDLIINKAKYKAELIPPTLIVKRFFAKEEAEVDAKQAILEASEQKLESLLEEHGGDEAALSGILTKADANKSLQDFYEVAWSNIDKVTSQNYIINKKSITESEESLADLAKEPVFNKALNAKSKLTLKGIKEVLEKVDGDDKHHLVTYLEKDKQLKAEKKNNNLLIKAGIDLVDSSIEGENEGSFFEEIKLIHQFILLVDKVATSKKAVRESQEKLDKLVFEQYPKLTEAEIKTLIVDDKWLATLQANVVAEIERVTQQLANRVKTLEERYAEPLPALTQSVELLSANVDEYLKKMGLQW